VRLQKMRCDGSGSFAWPGRRSIGIVAGLDRLGSQSTSRRAPCYAGPMVRRALVFSGVVGLGAIAICCASEEPSPDAASLDAPTPSDVAPDDSSAPVDDTNEPSPSPDAASASRVTRVYVGQDDAQLVVFALDDATGALTELSRTAIAGSTSFVALDGSGTRGAAVLEGDAEVVGLAITPGTGAAREVGSRRSSRGAGPTHVSIDGTGTRALVANYGGGTVSSFSLGADGALSEALDDEAPGANAHQILTTPSNRWALVPCLGSDRVAVLAFDATTGSLSGASAHDTAEGAGPRHLVVTADGAHVYLANELDSSLEALSFDEASGTLESLGVVSTLPAGFASRNSVAEIALGAGERFVYVSNRGHDSIAIFAIGADHRVEATRSSRRGGRGASPSIPRDVTSSWALRTTT
jgi:6-phosphogluconolactonase